MICACIAVASQERKSDYTLGMSRWLTSAYRTLKLTRKSDREEFVLYSKLVLLGFGVVGAIGFIIYFLAAMLLIFTGQPTTATP
jgi:protein translocase SEC61 complex gamma subunit